MTETTKQNSYAQRKLESGEMERFLSFRVSAKLKLTARFEKFKKDYNLSTPKAIDKMLKEFDY